MVLRMELGGIPIYRTSHWQPMQILFFKAFLLSGLSIRTIETVDLGKKFSAQ